MIAAAMIKGADKSLRGLKDRLESGAPEGKPQHTVEKYSTS